MAEWRKAEREVEFGNKMTSLKNSARITYSISGIANDNSCNVLYLSLYSC